MLKQFTALASGTCAVLALSAGTAAAQNLINSNTSIHSSLCVGLDCATSESYGSDTIRLKENNLRIHFDDTSSTGSFPNQDWRLEANETTNGGSEWFRIVDATANRAVATFEANAPTNSLYVDDGGRLGLGTSAPVVDVHVLSGNTPTLRLAQDGSSGFASQIFDIAANETNFFIRDATNGSALPFRIRPGAASNAIYINNNSRVGFGTTSPAARIDVQGDAVFKGAITTQNDDGLTMLSVTEANATASPREVARFVNNGRADVVIGNSDSNSEWAIAGGDTLRFRFGTLASGPAAKTQYMALTNTGDINIPGTITTGGTTCGSGCDLVFTEDYNLPTIADHAREMFALGHLPNVGPTIENQPINISDKLGRMLNELEHAHIYIAQQHDEIEALKLARADDIAALKAEITALKSQVDTLRD